MGRNKVKTLKNKEIREFSDKIQETYGIELSRKDKYEIKDNIVLINNEPLFFYFEKTIVPTLKIVIKDNFLKKITVDMGAVPYAAKGADMMRPGITNIEENIEKGEVISIIDETHHKPIAIGIALFSSEQMKNMKKGKVVKNIHYVGDDIWNYD